MTRIVHCPGCKVLLVEPTAGVAIYQCGNCFKVLYAKHAIQSHIQIQDEQMPSKLHNKVTPPPPPPLYKQRETGASPVSTSTYSPRASGDSRRLYTPRHADTGGPSSLHIQDMQKLALDAFPVQQDTSTTGCQKDEFEFQGQTVDVDMYSYHEPPPAREYEPSDYHSTLEDFDNHSHVTSEGSNYGASRRMDFYRPESRYDAQEDNAEIPRFRRPSVEVRPPLGNGSGRLANGHATFNKSTSSESSSYTDRQEGSDSQRRYPPLELPYVVCQHCKRFLEVPRRLPPLTRPYQKLRCGACQKVSRFSLSEKQSLEMVPSGMGLASSTTSSSPASTPAARHCTPYNYFNESRANKLDVLTSDHLHGSPSRASAPASFHHAAHSSNVFGEGKGYESAPEFQSSYSVASKESSTSTHHARSESGASSNNGRSLPMAPCLHELFGYESPSQFLKKQHQLSENRKTYKTNSKGIKGLLLSKLHLSHHPSSVIINGKTIHEDQVRRAEEQAGHIHPGSYWYDYHVGFWGVMGGPCVGIIPPGIEEFNYPMQRNCTGGKTGVVVNGRELHHQDLDILVKRGLPPTPYAAYTINIDGVVIDLATQTQIRCLGKLAPTMEKRGVGFGMYPLSRGL